MRMHENFADWYQPMTFGHNQEVFQLRWDGIDSAMKDLTPSSTIELVRLAFGKPLKQQNYLETFRKYFKATDPAFKSSGNERELQILAACALAAGCSDDELDYVDAALGILTASVCNTTTPGLEFDLVGIARHRIEREGAALRTRVKYDLPEATIQEDCMDEISTTWDDDPSLEAVPGILKRMGEITIEMLSSIQQGYKSHLDSLATNLTIQDEELQMLWWTVGDRSKTWDIPFDRIEPNARPIQLGYEASVLTTLNIESASIKSLLTRVGVQETSTLTIPEAVMACGLENLKTLNFPDACPHIFPLHFAIQRAIETDSDPSWIPGWSKTSRIDADRKFAGLDIAIQFFRECKLFSLLTDQ